ncbi:hypothetical protein R5M92_13555 [Halomonas sp. Bachu 37]|uniref:hypothetical protein n=1 Tax=Halomonas kashgarensis TaxID=3084920 RepID=UPI003217A885
MTTLVISKIKSPSGALGEIERVNIDVANQLPVSSWLDVELADTLLVYHPVSVQKVSRHYEVVSGFRAFHAVSALLDPEATISVGITDADESDLIRGALFELITHSLMHCPEAVDAKERVYRQLKQLTVTLRKKHGIKVPTSLSTRNLKALMGLKARRITHSRKRKSELQRIMESQ